MPDTVDGFSALTGGISQQPPTVRFPNQVTSAVNIDFETANGANKKPGSVFVSTVAGLTGSASYRTHPIDRDGTEQYVLIYGAGHLSAVDKNGTACTVHRLSQPTAYLGSTSPDSLRLTSIGDTTILINTTVATGYKTSTSYSVASEERDANITFLTTPANGSYVKALATVDDEPAGYWYYNGGQSTYATATFPTLAITVPSNYATATTNPASGRIFFGRFNTGAVTAASWNPTTRTLTKTGAFTNYTFQDGDSINITGGTGVTAEWYAIERRVSANAIILQSSIAAGSPADVTFDGIGKDVSFTVDLFGQSITHADDLALAYTRAIRAEGAVDAIVYPVRTSTVGTYQFRITNPYAGANSHFPATNAFRSGTMGYNLFGGPSAPFTGVPTIVNGSGPDTTKPVLERWTRVAAPGQSKAVLDPVKMPVRLTREATAGTWSGGWSSMSTALKPFAWYRLGDTSGTVALDEMGKNNGTYVGSPTSTATLLLSDTNRSMAFDGVNDTVTLGKLPGIETALAYGVTFEFWMASSTATAMYLFRHGVNTTSQGVYIAVNVGVTNRLSLYIQDAAATNIGAYADVANLTNGDRKHVAVAVNTQAGTVTFYVNGVAQSTTYGSSGLPSASQFSAISDTAYIGSNNGASDWFAGTLDEFTIHAAVMNQAMVTQRYNQGINASYSHPATFVLSPIPWVDRTSGTELSNPLPKLVENQLTIADGLYYDNRLLFVGGERLMFSSSGDSYNFFVRNVEQYADDDPVDVGLSSKKVTNIDRVVGVSNSILVFTKSSQQFEVTSNGALSINSITIRPTTEYPPLQGVAPITSGLQVYFTTNYGDATALYEQAYVYESAAFEAQNVSIHVPSLLPSSLRTLVGHPQSGRVVVLPSSGQTLYVYRATFRNQQERVQSAWTTWTYDATYRICDICVLGSSMYMLVESQSQYVLERVPLGYQAPSGSYPHVVYLDRRMSISGGTFGSGNTTWTIPVSDTTINRVITSTGDVYNVTTSGTTVTATGVNLSAANLTAGRSYTATCELTRPFLRQPQSGQPVMWAFSQHEQQAWDIQNTRTITFIAAAANTATQTYTYSSGSNSPASTQFISNFQGDCGRTTISFSDSGPGPLTLTAAMYKINSEVRA